MATIVVDGSAGFNSRVYCRLETDALPRSNTRYDDALNWRTLTRHDTDTREVGLGERYTGSRRIDAESTRDQAGVVLDPEIVLKRSVWQTDERIIKRL